jgi:hypothetical protein
MARYTQYLRQARRIALHRRWEPEWRNMVNGPLHSELLRCVPFKA